ncbi:MAG: DNA polymerase IV, partial [Acidimicrobiales bacterium]
MAIFRSYTPLVEPISLDEAFLDVTGAGRLHGDGAAVAAIIRERVMDEQGLGCSVGVATSKFVAKLASEAAKPKASAQSIDPGPGVVEVAPGGEIAFVRPLPVQALWGVGPATLERLRRLGVHTVADLAGLPVTTLHSTFGRAHGQHLHDLAHARDSRPVNPDQQLKSVSHEETFPNDVFSFETLVPEVARLGDATARRLRRNRLAGRTVTLKVRFGNFRTITRSQTMTSATDSARTITHVAGELLAGVDPSPGIRLIGVAVTNLDTPGARQLGLFDGDSSDSGWQDAERAVDQIRDRFGNDAVGAGRLIGPDGFRVKRRGEQQWGPDQET